jgi:anti-sigma28 factor (negative regulator of flagellin synthesis)
MKVVDASLNQAGSMQTGKIAQTDAVTQDGLRKAPGRDGGESDRVQLSSLSGALLDAARTDAQRSVSIERIQAQVRAGSYQVDAAAVSHRMVDDAITG